MIHAQSNTKGMLAALRKMPAGRKLARTLAATRYIDFPDDRQDKDWRRRTSAAIKDGSTLTAAKLASWRAFALAMAGPEAEKSPCLLFARQQSRLLLNMAGGAFENGGLSLDRLSGLPLIPGSAVKGCARRLALAALREWTTGQLRPGDLENLLAPAVEAGETPADLLFRIALVFGWSDLEWHGRDAFHGDKEWEEKRSDFAWACTPAPTGQDMAAQGSALGSPADGSLSPEGAQQDWDTIRREVSRRLCVHLGITPKDPAQPWKSLSHFAGTVSFLPACPWDKDPGIDLDVVTCHHGEYYKGNPAYASAPDTEEPVPVIFPAIAPGQTWVFLLHPTRPGGESHLARARTWLSLGLETFGIGAKTNAGYGWFDASEELNLQVQGNCQIMVLLQKLELEFANFASWTPDQKEVAILQLDDRRGDCRVWQESNSSTFAMIQQFAQSLGFHLP